MTVTTEKYLVKSVHTIVAPHYVYVATVAHRSVTSYGLPGAFVLNFFECMSYLEISVKFQKSCKTCVEKKNFSKANVCILATDDDDLGWIGSVIRGMTMAFADSLHFGILRRLTPNKGI
jgi:hypothetical protein